MHPKRRLRISASLDVIPFADSADEPSRINCSDCGGPLDLHQPDANSPDLLVGICESCRRWYLILADRGADEILMVLLPDREWFRAITRGVDSGPTDAVPSVGIQVTSVVAPPDRVITADPPSAE
jgi:hypothetical protein